MHVTHHLINARLTVLLLLLQACSDSNGGSAGQGGLGQTCMPNGACNSGHECFRGVCVPDDDAAVASDVESDSLTPPDFESVDDGSVFDVGTNPPGADCAALQFGTGWNMPAQASYCDLSGVNLAGSRLMGADLTGAKLIGTELRLADLTEATLMHANLSNANLRQAILRGAQCAHSNFRGASFRAGNVTNADLVSANLTDANFSSANLTGTDLANANLANANFNEADLTRANLTGADIAGATWIRAICPDGTAAADSPEATCEGHLEFQ